MVTDMAYVNDQLVDIEIILEDVAGNSIARPFEVDQRQAENYRYGPKVVSLKFEIL